MVLKEFTPPADDRYFEDYVQGRVYEFGEFRFDEELILEFARTYDPQYFHVDKEKAQKGPYKGLIASGLQTISAATRMYMDHYISTAASYGSPGMDEVRWTWPVRPGDVMRLRITILETAPHKKKDRGFVTAFVEGINQEDKVVTSLKIVNIIGSRNPLP